MQLDVRAAEEIEIFVPLPPEEVEARLASATGRIPGSLGTTMFWGTVGGGRFHLRLRRFGKRNLRPALTGTVQAAPGGSVIRAVAASPDWARPLGRAVTVAALGLSAATGVIGITGGMGGTMPAAMSGLMLVGSAVAAGWAIALPGWLVVEASEERGLLLDAVRAQFPEAAAAASELTRERVAEAPQAARRPVQPRLPED